MSMVQNLFTGNATKNMTALLRRNNFGIEWLGNKGLMRNRESFVVL